MKLHCITSLAFLFLCYGCNDRASVTPTIVFDRTDFENTIVLSHPDTICVEDALNPLDFYLVKDSLVLIENADNSQQYKAGLYSLSQGKLIREIAPKGEGPKEFVSCQLDVRENSSDLFYIDDFVQNKYWECNLDSIIANKEYLVKSFTYSRDVIRLCSQDSTYIGYNFWYLNNADYDNNVPALQKYKQMNGPKGRLANGHPYFVANVTGGFVFMSPDKNRIWVADFHDDKIHIYNDSLQEIKCLSGPDYFEHEFEDIHDKNYDHFVSFSKGTAYQSYIAYTKNSKYVYLVYEGTNGTYQRLDKLNPVEVFKFDWEGNPITYYKLDKYIRTISIDSQENFLYATSYNSHDASTVFIRYALK